MTTNIEIYNRFIELREKFISETRYQSNPHLIRENENYKLILELGPDIFPFLLDDLYNKKVDWLDALAILKGHDPVQEVNWGDMNAMIDDWKNYLQHN